MKERNSKKTLFLNCAFFLTAAGILLFLLNAPEETTAHLPKDEIHTQFHEIASKKEAEKTCTDCHSEKGVAPLPEGHPPKYRCLFCHKRD
jgi:hypothetical protein